MGSTGITGFQRRSGTNRHCWNNRYEQFVLVASSDGTRVRYLPSESAFFWVAYGDESTSTVGGKPLSFRQTSNHSGT